MQPAEWISRHREALALGAILIVAAALRCIALGELSVWHDEWTTILLGLQRTPGGMFRLLAQIDATRAPLHPLLLQAGCGCSEARRRRPGP
jgi:hypothetical protein